MSTETAVKAGTRRRTSAARSGRQTRRARHALTVLVFLLPSAVPLAMFTVYPMLHSLWASLHSWNILGPMHWVGLQNYVDLLQDPVTRQAFLNTALYVVGHLPLVYVGGLLLALGLNTAIPMRSWLRGFYFLPVVTSWIVVAVVWRWLLNPSGGLVNYALGLIGITGPGWWTDPNWAIPSIIIASAWKDVGFIMVILLAGLQAIPADLYEAAMLDGAGWWRRLLSVTLPMLAPTSFFVIVMSLISGFQTFDQVFAMTGGGPAGASTTVVQQIYNMTFRFGQAGMASALSWMLFVVIMIVTVIQIRGQKKWASDV